MTDSIKPQAVETRDQKIDRLLENSGHGARREDIEAAFAAGERAGRPPAELPPRADMFWDEEEGLDEGASIARGIDELLRKKCALGLINVGDELKLGRAIWQPRITVRVTEVTDSGEVKHELVRERASWTIEWPRSGDDERVDVYTCEFIDGEAAMFNPNGKRVTPTDEQKPGFERLAKDMRKYAYQNPGVILGAPA